MKSRRIPWSRLAVAGFIVITHLSYVNNGFTWLDHHDIEERQVVLPLSRITEAFTSRYGTTGYYRPLVTIVHSLDYAVYQESAPGFHLTNILLHLSVSLAAGVFLGSFFALTSREQLLASLIVGVHAVSWWTVGTISNLQELLVTLFTLLTIIFYIKARTDSSRKTLVWAILTTVGALFSKETALFWVPALIVLYELTSVKRYSKQPFPIWLGILGVSIGYVLLRLKFVPEVWKTTFAPLPLSEALGTRLVAIGKLLFHLINPAQPSPSDAIAVVGIGNPAAVITGFILIIFIAVTLKRDIVSDWGKAFILLGISILPAFNLVPLPRFSSTHYGYFAVPAVTIVAILLIRKLASQGLTLQRIGNLGVIIWLAISSLLTFKSGFQFQNDLTLFAPEVTRDPHFREGHFYLGNYYFGKGNIEKAKMEYEVALTVSPDVIAYVDTRALLINLAGVYLAENRLDEAEKMLLSTLKDAPAELTPAISYNLALVSFKRNDYHKVFELLADKEVDRTPAASLLLAEVLNKLGRSEEAREVLWQLTNN